MTPIRRSKVSKYRSASKFRRNVGKTKMANMKATPMRGGFRF